MSTLRVEVVRIKSAEKHPDAHSLDCYGVLGWTCISNRENGEPRYKVGDLVMYAPIDSVFPDKLAEWCWPTTGCHTGTVQRPTGNRLKTIKLRGCISQGMILGFGELAELYPELKDAKEGDDVSGILGITKFEPSDLPTALGTGEAKSHPSFHKFTDIDNFKNYPNIFLPAETVVVTEKLHGTSARYACCESTRTMKPANWFEHFLSWFGWKKTEDVIEFCIGSKNRQVDPNHNSAYTSIAKKHSLYSKLSPGMSVYGEIVGPGVQKNYTYGHKEFEFYVYDVMIDGQYLDYLDALIIIRRLQLTPVPLLYTGTYDPVHNNALMGGKTTVNSDRKNLETREGVVIKPLTERADKRIGRVILKLVNPEYLLKDQSEYH